MKSILLIKNPLIATALGLSLLIALPLNAEEATKDCSQCRIRKQNLCAQECAAAPYKAQIECRLDCVNEYCEHRCSEKLIFKAPASCNKCVEIEQNFCGSLCSRGSKKAISECKYQCASLRCDAVCTKD